MSAFLEGHSRPWKIPLKWLFGFEKHGQKIDAAIGERVKCTNETIANTYVHMKCGHEPVGDDDATQCVLALLFHLCKQSGSNCVRFLYN